ncbi:unnamed protein product [Psylliodes chrysocephalus]|uniref:Glucose-methanol-choline oxidoreductase N-terminal domain-containing protein n=1 Tax=Psylliodes chrysocephalus TaxID=3402493 RepID=A0A9P0GNA2_9CUCU|nr:unnamed protein product [Psylliodes chrysocephala]
MSLYYREMCNKIILSLIIIYGNGIFAQSDSDTVEHLKGLIYNRIANIPNYESPTDAKMFEAPEVPITEYGTYDFIIIGAGVTGSAIANRLSEIRQWRILLIEAGIFTDGDLMSIPSMFMLTVFSDYNWGFRTVPQKNACLSTKNHTCLVPRGKGVGGSSLLNALQYSRANPKNYNQWAKALHDSSWSYKNILKYFKKSENFHWTNPKAPVDLKSHGREGLLHVQHVQPEHPLNDIFIEANKQLGYDIIDFNSERQIGGSIMQLYTNNGTREDMGTVFITPFLDRPNLTVLTQSYVTKIEIDKITKVAKSVLFTNNGITYRARADVEVILSAGAIASPQILMLSGIGPKQHLQDVGIELIENLEVGSCLKEHALLSHLFFTSNFERPVETIEQQLSDFLKGYGSLTTTSTQAQGIAFYNVNHKTSTVPDLVIYVDDTKYSEMEKSVFDFNEETIQSLTKIGSKLKTIRFLLMNFNIKSKGTIRLKNKNPFEYPLIDPMLLSDHSGKDIKTMYRGIQQILRLSETPAFKKINLELVNEPLPACKHIQFKSQKYWYCFLKQLTMTGVHPMATCPMGVNKCKGAVVDSNLKVFGIKKLRVADASIFPASIAGHPSMTCLMIGEKISDVIKQEYL